MSGFDNSKLERVKAAAAEIKSFSPTDIAKHLSTPEEPVSARSLERICRHADVRTAATGALAGERKGIERASAKLAERKVLAAATEEEKASEARDKAIDAALTWLDTAEDEREYDYASYDKEGNPLGAGRIPDLVRFGLELARDRGKSRDAGRLLSERARIEREAATADPANRPPAGARVVLVLPGRVAPQLKIVDATAAKKAE